MESTIVHFEDLRRQIFTLSGKYAFCVPKEEEGRVRRELDELYTQAQSLHPSESQEIMSYLEELYNNLNTKKPFSLGGFEESSVHHNLAGALQKRERKVLTKEEVDILLYSSGRVLDIYGILKFSPEVLERMVTFSGDWLLLRDIFTLSPEEASILKEFSGTHLWLGISKIDTSCAEILKTVKARRLYLDNLFSLSGEILEHLSEFSGDLLSLRGLSHLSDEGIRILSQFQGKHLYLDGLQEINDIQAQSLAKFHTRSLDIGGLSSLSDTQASILKDFGGNSLILRSVTSLSDTAFGTLCHFGDKHSMSSYLDLSSLRTLSESMAKSIQQKQSGINNLSGLVHIAPEYLACIDSSQATIFLHPYEQNRLYEIS